jgi:hypothetical protein
VNAGTKRENALRVNRNENSKLKRGSNAGQVSPGESKTWSSFGVDGATAQQGVNDRQEEVAWSRRDVRRLRHLKIPIHPLRGFQQA